MGVIAQLAERVAVMYAGKIVELGEIKTIFDNPMHPYTFGLLESIPKIDQENEVLFSIPGDVPDMLNPPSGCSFHPRCPYATQLCRNDIPLLEQFGKGHLVACIRAENLRGELRLKKNY